MHVARLSSSVLHRAPRAIAPLVRHGSTLSDHIERNPILSTRQKKEALKIADVFEQDPLFRQQSPASQFHSIQHALKAVLSSASTALGIPQMEPGGLFHTKSEYLPGAVPVGRSTPQHPPYGTIHQRMTFQGGFIGPEGQPPVTADVYRLNAQTKHAEYIESQHQPFKQASYQAPDTNRYKFTPPKAEAHQNYVESFKVIGDDPNVYTLTSYAFDKDMGNKAFSSDCEQMIIPTDGAVEIFTEMGSMIVEPQEIAVIPPTIKYKVSRSGEHTGPVTGLILDLKNDQKLGPPPRGVVGANALAEYHDFEHPQARPNMDSLNERHLLITKKDDTLYSTRGPSPFDVLGWSGSGPYKYDMRRFIPIGTSNRDHGDPSTHIVLCTKDSNSTILELAAFAPRQVQTRNTFSPPYYHRNLRDEVMFLCLGQKPGADSTYESKQGMNAGDMTFHPRGSEHGPDKATFEKEVQRTNQEAIETPDGAISIMVETRGTFRLAEPVYNARDKNYGGTF